SLTICPISLSRLHSAYGVTLLIGKNAPITNTSTFVCTRVATSIRNSHEPNDMTVRTHSCLAPRQLMGTSGAIRWMNEMLGICITIVTATLRATIPTTPPPHISTSTLP